MLDLEQRNGRSAGVLLHPTSLPSGKIDIDIDRLASLVAAGWFFGVADVALAPGRALQWIVTLSMSICVCA